jgi:zinc transport system substrate-binding protein
LLALDADLQRRLSPLSTRAYVVFHNAYEHLEARYGLRHAGVVAVNPDRPPGAASIRRIRHIMAAHKVSCVFASPQFSPRLAHAIATEPSVRVVSLDPLGTGLTPGGEAYFQLMDNLASAFEDCLS